MTDLKGKTVLITGGGRDIGRACSIALGNAGANVGINYFASSEGADSAVKDIEAAGGSAFAQKGDMTSQADVDAFVNAGVEKWGSIDVLVHVTGGIVARKSLPDMTVEHWDTVMDLNVTSFVRFAHAAQPHLNDKSSIVVLSSQAAKDGGGPGALAYAASKGALTTLTRGLAKELGPKTRVNAVCPGMIDTDFHNIFTKDAVREHVANITPLKREGRSEEVAELVTYLASEKSSFLTGTNIDVNGGLLVS